MIAGFDHKGTIEEIRKIVKSLKKDHELIFPNGVRIYKTTEVPKEDYPLFVKGKSFRRRSIIEVTIKGKDTLRTVPISKYRKVKPKNAYDLKAWD
jgi:hypothetical protein